MQGLEVMADEGSRVGADSENGATGAVVGARGANDDDTGLEAWEQQPTTADHPAEDPLHYHVFEIYCLLGHERTVRKAVEKWHLESGLKTPKLATFAEIATDWRWQERADKYWLLERRRAEHLLQEQRNAALRRYAALAEVGLAKLELALSRLEIGLSKRKLSPHFTGTAMRSIAEAASKFLEVHRVGLGDAEEDRKRRGRPPEDAGELPPLEDRVRPPEETVNELPEPPSTPQP